MAKGDDRPLQPADMAQQLERMLSAAYGMALCLQYVAARPTTEKHASMLSHHIKAAQEEAKDLAWEFVGDRVARENRARAAQENGHER